MAGLTVPGIQPISLNAAADLTGKRGYLVAIDTSGNAAVASAAGQKVIGALLDEPAVAGRPAAVAYLGRVSVRAGSGGFTAGDLLKANASGLAVAASLSVTNTSDGGSATDPLIGSYVFGMALETAAENEYGDVVITHSGAVATTAA
jgi:hypothetical protein